MFALPALRRSILTTSRLRTVTNLTSSANTTTAYRPLLNERFFTHTSKMSKEGVHNLQNKDDWKAALDIKDTLLVLDCFAVWCGPCKVIAPQVVKFSKEYPTARFYKLDVDDVPDVAQELGIRAMPTFLLFKNGDKVAEVVGANPKALEAAIKANLGEAPAAAAV